MSTAQASPTEDLIVYPDCDGNPIAENTLQYEWIVRIKGGLDVLYKDRPDVFVAGDLLWYPVKGHPEICVAPDALVAIGRPKGHRGSYKQWEEGGQAPQVVFEILSPSNGPANRAFKLDFYEEYGVEEYYEYDPEEGPLKGWLREGDRLVEIPDLDGFVSPRLGIRFETEDAPEALRIFHPDGRPFIGFVENVELAQAAEWQAQIEREQAKAERERAQIEHARAEAEHARAEAEHVRAEALMAKLRALGIDPEA